MKTNLDEIKLTAYALNELDEPSRSAVEKCLAHDPVARRWVEEVRQTAGILESELQAEDCPSLTSEQTREIQKHVREEKPGIWTWRWFSGFRLVEALAVVAIIAVLAAMLLPSLSKSKSEAKNLALNSLQNPRKDLRPAAPGNTTAPTQKPVELEPANQPKTETVMAPIVAPPQPTGLPSTPTVTLAPNRSGGAVDEAKSKLSLDAVQSAPAASDILAPHDLSGNGPVSQSAAPTFALNDQNGSSSGGIVLEKQRQIQMRATEVASINGQFNFQQGASASTGAGGSGGAGGVRWGNSDSRRLPRISYASASADGYDGATPPGEVPTLGDIPTTGRLYRSVNDQPPGTATYPHLIENSFLTALNHPLSTFSIDVDTASYANVRRFLNSGQLPPPDAVRIEEMVNYFKYDYPQPRGNDPFAANIEIAGCPWNSDHRLVRIGLKGREIAQDKRPPSNFVFLIDVSGSMRPQERLPLIKQALRQLVKKMTESDRVAIVVYASQAGVKLESTSCEQKEKILEAIDELDAGGSTAGAAGIQSAYAVAEENFIRGGVNRVLLCTDGDFNVGMTDQSQLVKLIQDKAKSGVFLTTLGVGTDNYKDALMQKLADKGNGNYAYLDSLEEAQKVLIDQMSGTLVTIAKDVKIQVEFNPAQVRAYRLIGYEKRMLRKEDFNNDKKDAGEIGAGHTVTALYEVVPAGAEIGSREVDDLKYQHPAEEKPERYVNDYSKELLTLKLRYKQPDGDKSRLLEFPVTDSGKSFRRASADFRFAAAVAEFGMLLRDSEYKGDSSFHSVLGMAQGAKGMDAEGYRSEFLTLVKKAQGLAGN